MTDEELKERASDYRQLLEIKQFRDRFIPEIKEKIESLKEDIVTDLIRDRLSDKAFIAGMKFAIDLPLQAIKETEDNEALEGTS